MFVSKKNKLPAAIINPRLKDWWAAVCHVCPQCSRDKSVLSENARNQTTKAFILENKIKQIVACASQSGAASMPECCTVSVGHGRRVVPPCRGAFGSAEPSGDLERRGGCCCCRGFHGCVWRSGLQCLHHLCVSQPVQRHAYRSSKR